MENSRRAVSARVEDIDDLMGVYPREDGEKMPDYWARLHAVLDEGAALVASFEKPVDVLLTPEEVQHNIENDLPMVPAYKPTKAHQNFAVEPIKPKANSNRMTMSGFCAWPGRDGHGHELCQNKFGCTCECHA